MRPTRHRAASMALAALFAAAPLAFGTAAHAGAPVHDGGSVVTFGGDGLSGVARSSAASAGWLTMLAKSALRVVNNTGHRATVLLDAATTGEIAIGASAELPSRQGPVSLALKPGCGCAKTSSVPVHPVASPTVRQPASPAANPAASATIGGGTTSGSGGAGGGVGARTGGLSGGAGRSAVGVAPPNVAAQPDGQADPDRTGGGETSAAPGAGTDVTATDQPASLERVSETGRTGLLAMIATVCVVGVSAGAIRAIATQRATRTPSA
jgi:hypothetical protein